MGYKIAGIAGILVSILGAVLPPFVILTIISAVYSAFKQNFAIQALLTGMKSGVSAVIISVVVDMGMGIVKLREPILILGMVLAFIANYWFKVNVVLIIVIAACVGAMVTYMKGRRQKK